MRNRTIDNDESEFRRRIKPFLAEKNFTTRYSPNSHDVDASKLSLKVQNKEANGRTIEKQEEETKSGTISDYHKTCITSG